MPPWLVVLAIASLVIAGLCAIIILIDLFRGHRQHMWIMNVVWPVTALYSGPLGLWAYFRWGRLSTRHRVKQAKEHGEENPGKKRPMRQIVAIAATHCGSGCTLGDIIAEWLVVAAPLYLFGQKIFGTWALDFAFAYVLGIAFQYFTIAPMRGLGFPSYPVNWRLVARGLKEKM
jgi:hypothetical protein